MDIAAIGFALLAALCWGSAAIFIRLGLRGIKPTTGTLISLSSSLVLTLGAALIFNRNELFDVPLKVIPLFAIIGMANYGIGRVLNYSGVALAGAARSGVITSMSPLISTILAVVLTGERPTLLTILGTFAIVGGIILIISEGMRGPTTRPAGAVPAQGGAERR